MQIVAFMGLIGLMALVALVGYIAFCLAVFILGFFGPLFGWVVIIGVCIFVAMLAGAVGD
jgi:hypothetical protein